MRSEKMEEKVVMYNSSFIYYSGVSRFKSINRAERRGHISPEGIIYPNRPFNNRKCTKGRALNVEKMNIYECIKKVKKCI
jgi:hypothetical protein